MQIGFLKWSTDLDFEKMKVNLHFFKDNFDNEVEKSYLCFPLHIL